MKGREASMEYVYAGMWLLVGLILIFRMGKENKVFYLAGAFFLILGGWWLANALTEQNLFAGTWGIVLRVITAVALVLLCAVFWKTYQKDRAAFEAKKKQDQKTEEGASDSSEDKGDPDQW